jgi:hypothetical protein
MQQKPPDGSIEPSMIMKHSHSWIPFFPGLSSKSAGERARNLELGGSLYEDFNGHVQLGDIGGVKLCRAVSRTPHRVARTSELIRRDDRGVLKVVFQLQGRAVIEQGALSKNGVAPSLVPPPARDAGLDVHSANPSRDGSLSMPVALAVEDRAAEFGDGQNLTAGSCKLLRKEDRRLLGKRWIPGEVEQRRRSCEQVLDHPQEPHIRDRGGQWIASREPRPYAHPGEHRLINSTLGHNLQDQLLRESQPVFH